MSDLATQPIWETTEVSDIIQAMRHAKRQQAVILRECNDHTIEVCGILIDVETPQRVHALNERTLLIRERRSSEKAFSFRMHEEIVEYCDGEERYIIHRFSKHQGNFAPVLCVGFATSTPNRF